MKNPFQRTLLAGLTGCLLFLIPLPEVQAQSSTTVGEPAPAFTLKNAEGDAHSLSEYEGKYVVLEWVDFKCPYVGKHYGSGNMQKLQEIYTDKEVAWLSIYSAAPSHRAYVPPEKMAAKNEELGGNQTALLMDPTGEVGQTYGATNTPHMFVIDPDGELIYKGGIDDKPTTDEADIETATNYVRKALDAAMNGEEVKPKRTKPYGCPIKYASQRQDGNAENADGADSGWSIGQLRPNGLRIKPSGRNDASEVLEPEQFSSSEVRNAYKIATEIPEVLNKLYCWCGCENRGIHRSNLACFEDGMAEHCAVCRGTAEIAYEMVQQGVTDAGKIQAAVDTEWGSKQAQEAQSSSEG